MLRGCISLGDVRCDECQGLVSHSEQYLLIEEPDGEKKRLCMSCSLEKGYARYKESKRERVLTFFPE